MIPAEINSILEPLAADLPCGVDLEASAIAELDRLAQAKPEQQIGNTVVPAEEPDWKLVKPKALQILGQSKDLRAATHLARALLRSEGWPGFATGLLLLGTLVERYWEGLFPRLDPDDDNDPTMRINIMMNVADTTVLNMVRATPLISSRTLGRFSLKEIDAVAEAGPTSDGNGAGPVSMTSIEAAALDADLETLQQTAVAVKDCGAHLTALETAVASHVESARVPSFAKLAALIRKADIFLSAMVAKRVPAAAGHGTSENNGVQLGGGGLSGSGLPGIPWTGAIKSRDDVVKTLDAIIAYYERYEPSSPIPIFMARSKRLVMMGFVDIVRELVPDALSAVDVLRGRVEE